MNITCPGLDCRTNSTLFSTGAYRKETDMNNSDHTDWAGALMRASQHWEKRHLAEESAGKTVSTPAAFTIAVSRQSGAGGTAVAHAVGRRLQWPVYDHELLEHIAREMNVRVSLLESVDERRINWLQESIESFALSNRVSEGSYVRHLLETMFSLATHGECVIVGRGAAHVLPTATTLRVRLLADLDDRVAAFAQQQHLTLREAGKRARELDHEQVHFIKSHFQADPTDPKNYDLILNTSRFSVEQCADLIVDGLRAFQQGTKIPRLESAAVPGAPR